MRATGGASEAVAAVKYGIDGARVVVVGRKLPQPVNALDIALRKDLGND